MFVDKAASVIVNQLFGSYIVLHFLFYQILFFFVTKNMAKAVIKFVMEISCIFYMNFQNHILKVFPFILVT
jgi:hypothetical protein